PTVGDQDPSLAMLQQLANQSGGTYRGAMEQDQVFELIKDAYNEIYNSHVLTFRSNTLKPGQNHKVRLNIDYKNLKAKSPPHSVYVPASEGLPSSYFIYGGVGCLVLGLLGVIGLLIFVIWRRRKEQREREASEFDEFLAAQQGGPGGVIPAMAVAAASDALPPILQNRPEYSDEPPGSYVCTLRAVGGPAHGRTFYIVQESTTIGSSEESDLMILDGTVSKKHAGIRIQEGNRFELHDFGSTNGVFINDKRISKQYLKEGDRIRVGETELTFSVPK
ncbi:MAG: FHA domain-containing protein, partial [Myxococcota bacterium]